MLRLLVVIPLLVACASAPGSESASPPLEPEPERAPTTTPTPPWESSEARAALDARPDPTACEIDDDCVPFHGGGEAPPAVCCRASATGVTNRAHQRWVEDFRARFCAGAECTPAPLPGALPGACFFEGRCVAGRCTTACEAGPVEGAPDDDGATTSPRRSPR